MTDNKVIRKVWCGECGEEKPMGNLNGYGQCTDCYRKQQDAKNFPKEFDLAKGDSIAITGANGRDDITYTGTVINAQYWGEKNGWYIEFTHTSNPWFRGGSPVGSYGYWKQGSDGGKVEKTNR